MEQGQIIWYEIPVQDLDRGILFYSNVLNIAISKSRFLETEYAIINKEKATARGALVVKEKKDATSSIMLYFYVIDLSYCLRKTEQFGGTVTIPKTLLKQKNTKGNITINSNLIDDNIGYFAEVIDTEGNTICFYSNS